MNETTRYVIYFLLGGSLVSISTYLGSQGRSFLAAFVSTFPALTGTTFILIYLNGGSDSLVDYAKNLLWFIVPWILYVLTMIVGVPSIGFWPATIVSLTLFMSCAGLMKFVLG